MSPFEVTGLMFLSMLFLMGAGLPVVYCLGAVGVLAGIFLWGDGARDIVYFLLFYLLSKTYISKSCKHITQYSIINPILTISIKIWAYFLY